MCHRKGILESILQFRQMMAESKFFEVQKLIEVELSIKAQARFELLKIYFDSLKSQRKNVPVDIILELSEYESENNQHETVNHLLDQIPSELSDKFFLRIIKLKMTAAIFQGQIEFLYKLISEFYFKQFQKQNPFIPEIVKNYVEKYYPHDFNLKLKELAIALLRNDLSASEDLIKQLILSTMEKSSARGIKSKLNSIFEILKGAQNKSFLDIYQSYCMIAANGIREKSEYKKIIEMIIFFDDFKFQALVLHLLHQNKLFEEAKDYAIELKKNKAYNFVHFEKYFPELKKYFIQSVDKITPKTEESIFQPDLKLTAKIESEFFPSHFEIEDSEEDQRFIHLLKYQNYNSAQLCELAVSFLQSEMPRVALKACEIALSLPLDDVLFLKSSYLKLTCLLRLQDYRAAMDTCLDAMKKASSKDDILSFLYAQAEIYIRLNQKREAKNILTEIVFMDSKYRLAKERLDKLNEI
jgi:hypothetical protein